MSNTPQVLFDGYLPTNSVNVRVVGLARSVLTSQAFRFEVRVERQNGVSAMGESRWTPVGTDSPIYVEAVAHTLVTLNARLEQLEAWVAKRDAVFGAAVDATVDREFTGVE
jgi:hypothetical protein